MQNELYSGKALLAKRRAAAALKIYRDGKVIVRGLNQTSAGLYFPLYRTK